VYSHSITGSKGVVEVVSAGDATWGQRHADMTAALDEAVADGRFTADERDAVLARDRNDHEAYLQDLELRGDHLIGTCPQTVTLDGARYGCTNSVWFYSKQPDVIEHHELHVVTVDARNQDDQPQQVTLSWVTPLPVAAE
jgi:hypothetical protein